MRLRRSIPLLLAALSCAAGCGLSSPPSADLARIYQQAARHGDFHRTPVIVIPGILGSRLVDADGTVVWGAFGGEAVDPETPDGARRIALPMRPGAPLAALRDEVVATGALDRLEVNVAGFPVQLGAYAQILDALGAGGFRDQQLAAAGAVDYGEDHFTCFQFAYDWRRDNVENARRLAAFIREKRAYVRQQLADRYGEPDADVRFQIVAHSMGGLIARYYLRYGDQELPEDGGLPELTWEGAKLVERAVLIGTPSAGSVRALYELTAGIDFGAFAASYSPAVLGTMPSIYQLMPRPRHGRVRVDHRPALEAPLFDPELWIERGWGLASTGAEADLEALLPDVTDPAERRRIAHEHLRNALARAEQLTRALDRPASRPAGLALHLFAGDALDTPAELTLAEHGAGLWISDRAPGDGTVTRASALADERPGGSAAPRLSSAVDWSSVTFLFREHLMLTGDPTFIDNLLFLLLEAPDEGS